MSDCACATSKASSRRSFLGTAALAALACAAPARAAGPALADNRIGGDVALARLMEGNARFAAGLMRTREFASGRSALAGGQRPIAAVLGCADSRVSPELAFDQSLGDLFVVRLAGNFANDDAIASMEYAAQFLDVPLIVVLGHSQCGAVSATLKVLTDNAVLPGHLPGLAASIQPAAQAASRHQPARLLEAATAENVRHAVARLATSTPILAPLRERGQIKVVGAVYELSSGKVQLI